jgi:hypothetical protein
MKKNEWIIELISGLLALLFLYTAFSKLMEFRHFSKEMTNQEISRILIPYLIYGLPPVEVIIGLMLLVPRFRLYGLGLSSLLMALFSGYVALVTFHFYKRVPCSCAGVFKLMSWPQHLVFNVFFTALALTGVRLYVLHKKRSVAPAV